MYAKLPTTPEEIADADAWKKDKDETANIVASATEDTTQSTIDKENSEDNKKQLCNNRPKSDCHEWNDTKKYVNKFLIKVDVWKMTLNYVAHHKNVKIKKKWYKENFVDEIIKTITLIAICFAIIDFFAFFNYQHHYGLRFGNFLLTFINFVGKIFGKEIIEPDDNYGFK